MKNCGLCPTARLAPLKAPEQREPKMNSVRFFSFLAIFMFFVVEDVCLAGLGKSERSDL